MRIKKISQAFAVVGKILNAKSDSNKDTYSADYINKALDALYPVGSIYITKTNESPGSYLGGTWEMFNKDFSSFMNTITNDNIDEYFTKSENISTASIGFVRNGKTLRIRLLVKLATTFNEDNLVMGTFNLEKFGVSRFSLTKYAQIGGSDSAECAFTYQVSYEGEVILLDIINKTGTHALEVVGNTLYFDITDVIYNAAMLDEACDKFYWRRTA